MNHFKSVFRGWVFRNSLFLKIMSVTAAAIILVGVLISFFVVRMSEKTYIDTYAQANNKVITQVQEDYARLNEDIAALLTTCSDSWAVQSYLSNTTMTPQEEFETIYQMQTQIANASATKTSYIPNLIILGNSGKTHVRSGTSLTTPVAEIMESELVRKALQQPDKILYQYLNFGYTTTTYGQSCIVATKVLQNKATDAVYGIAMVLITQSDFGGFYKQLVDGNINKVYVLSAYNGQVMSSNVNRDNGKYKPELNKMANSVIESGALYEHMLSSENTEMTVLAKSLPLYDFRLISIINETALLDQMYHPADIILTAAVIIAITMLLLFIIVRKATKPITLLARRMPQIVEGDFTKHIEVKGGGEARELASAFNHMLDGLNKYVNRLVTLQEEKRLAEIHALQMQINPHFMYNTLTCIKFLIWQGDVEKSTATIDAFINLLRNTISNKDEMITLAQEIDNLKNYVQIQQTRYGDKVRVSYTIAQDCQTLQIPKMLLQPFVENAFFHAFANRKEGIIRIFAHKNGDRFICEIMDNGTGMGKEQVEKLWSEGAQKTHPFSGIGVKNVNDRIRLLYGSQYGIKISTTPGAGTIITVTLPAIK